MAVPLNGHHVLGFVVVLLAGCSGGGGGGGPAFPITDQPLQGVINGAPWTFVQGHTDAFLSEGEDDFFAQMYAEAFTPCTGFPTGDHIIVSVPKETGEYRFDDFLNMTFVFQEGGETINHVAFTGRIEVTAVTTTSATGGLHAIYEGDPDFEVDGYFDIAVCAD